MKSYLFDPAECGALNVLSSVLAIHFGKPVSYDKLWMRTLNPENSASRRVEVAGMVRTIESSKASHSLSFEGTLDLCSPTEGQWTAHAGEQVLLIAGGCMSFCRMSPAHHLLHTFKLFTHSGNLVIGSNFHDVAIVSP